MVSCICGMPYLANHFRYFVITHSIFCLVSAHACTCLAITSSLAMATSYIAIARYNHYIVVYIARYDAV